MTENSQESKQEAKSVGQNERLKIWVGLIKFLVGTVAVGLITTIINAKIQSKELKIKAYEKEQAIKIKENKLKCVPNHM